MVNMKCDTASMSLRFHATEGYFVLRCVSTRISIQSDLFKRAQRSGCYFSSAKCAEAAIFQQARVEVRLRFIVDVTSRLEMHT